MGDAMQTRKLFVMRHAERVDFTFGNWIPSSFDKNGCYIQANLNMPESVPRRKNPMHFDKDCPLTQIGLFQATLTGEAFKKEGVKFSHVFSSPSLRCVQTCTNVLKASDQSHLPIHIEPGLFEFFFWYQDSVPTWMTVEEYKKNGFNVALDYEPVVKVSELDVRETAEEFYMRNNLVTSKSLEKYSGDLLFVAHAASLDTCTRQLTGNPPRTEKDVSIILPRVSYASVAVAQQSVADKKWSLVPPPILPMRHTNNAGFDWTDLEK